MRPSDYPARAMDRSLASIADELAIRDLIADFADGVTRLDVEAIVALFAPDGVWEVTGWGITGVMTP